jgi:hypothetical protein
MIIIYNNCLIHLKIKFSLLSKSIHKNSSLQKKRCRHLTHDKLRPCKLTCTSTHLIFYMRMIYEYWICPVVLCYRLRYMMHDHWDFCTWWTESKQNRNKTNEQYKIWKYIITMKQMRFVYLHMKRHRYAHESMPFAYHQCVCVCGCGFRCLHYLYC